MDHMRDVMTTPVYVIDAHSCILNPHYAKENEIPLNFKIPKNTTIVSFGSPGDFVCSDNETIQVLHERLDDIRKFMYVHSDSDVLDTPNHWKRKRERSLFGSMKRAADGTLYPNISFDLNNIDKDRPTRRAYNQYGIYRLDTLTDARGLNNTRSLVTHDLSRENFTLQDLIQEVYEKTGLHKGIFISLGCLSPYLGKATTKFIEKAEHIYETANILYNTVKPTMTKEEIIKRFGSSALPVDILIDYTIAYWSPAVVEKMIKDKMLSTKACLEYNVVHVDDIKELKRCLRK
jgi:hypothetical protein